MSAPKRTSTDIDKEEISNDTNSSTVPTKKQRVHSTTEGRVQERFHIEKRTPEGLIDGQAILDTLKLAPNDHLDSLPREKCSACGVMQKYFCYTCLRPMGNLDLVPKVTLPVKLDIVHHPSEKVSKSSALHAPILCGQEQVGVREFPNLPDYNEKTDVILFPSEEAPALHEMSQEEFDAIERVIVLDSQWHRVNSMLQEPVLVKLRKVRIGMYATTFWRHQPVGDHCLATIEAIYYFYREYYSRKNGGVYNGEADNLLWYYKYLRDLVVKRLAEKPKPSKLPTNIVQAAEKIANCTIPRTPPH